MNDNARDCIFCNDTSTPIIYANSHFYAIFDSYPVNPGHLLVVSQRHIPSIFDLSVQEFAALYDMIHQAKEKLDHNYQPAGYNLGTNSGTAAGQTIFHFHLHIIPRFFGDTDDPRGGIRNLKQPLVTLPD